MRQLLEQQIVSRVSLEDNTVTLYLKEPQGGQSVLTYQIGNPDWFTRTLTTSLWNEAAGDHHRLRLSQGWVPPTG